MLDLIKQKSAFIVAIGLSAFIYLDMMGIEAVALNSVVITIALYCWLVADKKSSFVIGFLIGLLWFWWIGLSFRYTDYPFLLFVVPFGVAFIYGVIFYLVSFLPVWGRAIFFVFGFLVVEPFGFAWMKIDLMLINTIYSANGYALMFVMVAFVLFYYIRSSARFVAIVPLVVAVVLPTPKASEGLDLNYHLVESNISQDIKWEKNQLAPQVENMLYEIDSAVAKGYELVVLPEAVVPYFLNLMPDLMQQLIDRSSQISIVMGALYYEDDIPYNSSYIFVDGKMKVAKKMFLVPFGEGDPLPEWFQSTINNIFFKGAGSYKRAKAPTDYQIKDLWFRNAICYEATIEQIYKDSPKYIIALSNNGWFVPSIEPTIQKLFMKLYAKRYGVMVLHSSNQSPSGVID